MDPKFIELFLSKLYQYAIIGGILLLAGIMLKSFVSTVSTNIWMRWFNRSRMISEETKVFMDGYWWELKKLGFNRTRLVRKDIDENGKLKSDDEIYLEMPTRIYWGDKITYK